MAVHVFIDGQEGTTGLRILERFANRTDIELMQIDPEKRKDPQERKKYINQSDLSTATNYIRDIGAEGKYATIERYLKQVKKL